MCVTPHILPLRFHLDCIVACNSSRARQFPRGAFMPSLSSISKTKNMNCNILLFLGGLLLCLGLYFGLSKSGNLQLVLILLGGSIAAFSVVVVVLLKSHTFGSAYSHRPCHRLAFQSCRPGAFESCHPFAFQSCHVAKDRSSP